MGYARAVFRGSRIDRYTLLLLASFGAAACGASPPPTTLTHEQPLPTTGNQQGRRAEATSESTSDDEALPPSQPSIAGVYLWCRVPTGRACHLAAAALGTDPKDLRGLPESLLTVEDLSDDCTEPTIHTIGARLAQVFGIPATGWRDQGGTYLDASSLGDMYSAAGCINDTDGARPIAKISAASSASPRVYLVRVWEGST